MQSFDTNILLHALNESSPQHVRASAFIESLTKEDDVAISELMLAELYRLLRNPVVLVRPLDAASAVKIIRHFRSHPRWKLIGFPVDDRRLHDQLWAHAAKVGFAYRRLYDVRLALTLQQHGVTQFATTNTKDFIGLGFAKVWNPLG